MIREKAIEKVEKYIKSDMNTCMLVLKGLENKKQLSKKDQEKKELYQDMIDIFEDILSGGSVPKDEDDEYDALVGSACTLLNLLESGIYTVKEAIKESEIRKHL